MGIVNATDILGHSLAAVGDYEGAMRAYEQALGAGVRDLREEAVPLLYHYGLSRLRAGDAEAAATLFEEARGCPSASRRSSAGTARWALPTLRACAATPPRGGRPVRRGPHARARGRRRGSRQSRRGVAMVVTASRAREPRGAARRRRARGAVAEEGLALGPSRGEPRLLARTLEGLAALSLGERRREAARLLGVAEAIRAEVGAGSRTPRGSTSIGCRAACATVWETGRSHRGSTGAGGLRLAARASTRPRAPEPRVAVQVVTRR